MKGKLISHPPSVKNSLLELGLSKLTTENLALQKENEDLKLKHQAFLKGKAESNFLKSLITCQPYNLNSL